MSVQVNTYIAFGMMTEFKSRSDDDYSKIEPYLDSTFKGIHHHNGLCVISDGMNGDYEFIGRVLEKSPVHEHLQNRCAVELTDTEKELIGSLITSQFGIQNPDVKLWIFSHYR